MSFRWGKVIYGIVWFFFGEGSWGYCLDVGILVFILYWDIGVLGFLRGGGFEGGLVVYVGVWFLFFDVVF